jgi:hypothetical protein
VEFGATFAIVAGLDLTTTWTFSDFRYTSYTITTGTPPRAMVLDGQAIPGIPQHWLHFLWRARPGFAHGAWAELEETHSSGFVVNGRHGGKRAPQPVRGLQQPVQPGVCEFGRYQRGPGALL